MAGIIMCLDGMQRVVYTIETKMHGHDSYAVGVEKIIEIVLNRFFQAKRYSVLDLIEIFGLRQGPTASIRFPNRNCYDRNLLLFSFPLEGMSDFQFRIFVKGSFKR